MRWIRLLTTTLVSAAVAVPIVPAFVAQADADRRPHGPAVYGLARQVLPAGDGWASAGSGTTGGQTAGRGDVYTVGDRSELLLAAAGDQPKIIYVRGRIDANTNDHGQRLSCADYARDGYTLDSYLETYDPDVWGRTEEPSGPIEDARAASASTQAAQINIPIGSNTTLIGLPNASIKGANLRINGETNVIIRGLTLTDAHDCFPAWDPTDGDTGNWNSAYDLISLTGATNVWVDHNDLSDGRNLDSAQPTYFGRPYQVHDGALDITNASDLVTVSYNLFHDHDKTMLIGSSDSRTTDRGKLRVTIHHNQFRDLGQRVPRVRFGQVDVYNNHYVETTRGDDYEYVYSWGVGVESHIVAERNYLSLAPTVDRSTVIGRYNGDSMSENGNLVNGRPKDLLAAYNALHDPDLTEVEPWTPLLRRTVHPAPAVPWLVARQAGPRRLHHNW